MSTRQFVSWVATMVASLTIVSGVPARAVNVPKVMNYQGFLTGAGNNPRQGVFKMSFSIFADSTGGTALWSETYATADIIAYDGVPMVKAGREFLLRKRSGS